MSADWTDTNFLVCRDIMHAWEPQTAFRTGTGFTRVMKCPRCGSTKEQTLDPYGYITGSKISYPEGYLRPPGEGRINRHEKAMLRLETWERV